VFLKYYQLREQPFGVTPDPRFLMDTPSHREAWATLHYCIESGRGFVGLVAPPGLGKTTLLFRFMEELRGHTKTAFLFQTQCDSDEFLTLLLNDLADTPGFKAGVSQGQNSSAIWQSRCERALTTTHAEGAAILLQQGQSLVCTASIGAAPSVGAVVEMDVSLSGECFRTRRPISCENTHVDQRLSVESRQNLPFTSFLIAPLCSNNRVVGVVEVFSLSKSAFGATERTALYELGGEESADDGFVQARSGPIRGAERAALHEALHANLLRESEKGVPPVLIVDEAQNLSDSVLETIRLLSDFETPRSKLLQVILAGQTELRDRLSSPGLVHLRQRISMMTELAPLTQREVREYIAHRLRIAGYTGAPLFTPEAYDLVAELSNGIPRNVNNICFQAMSLAWASGTTKIGTDVLREVSTDVNWGQDSKSSSKPTVTGTAIEAHSGSLYPAQDKDVSDAYSVELSERCPQYQLVETAQPLVPGNGAGIHSTPEPSWMTKLKGRFTVVFACACIILLMGGVWIWRRAPLPKWGPVHAAAIVSSPADSSLLGVTGQPMNAERPVAYSSSAVPIMGRRSNAHSHRKAAERPSSSPLKATPNTFTAANLVSNSNGSPPELPANNPVSSLNTPPSPSEIPTTSVEGQGHTEVLLRPKSSKAPTTEVVNRPESANPEVLSGDDAHTSGAPSNVREPSRVVDAQLLKMVPPIYPASARRAKIEGDVVLSALISKEGTVEDVRVISGNRNLINAAVDAVKQWRYEAFLMNGQPEDVRRVIVVNFSLNNK
jgi:TonB family protein